MPGAPAMRWACHRDTRRGDLAVLYRSRRAKDLAYLFRATSDAVLRAFIRFDPGWWPSLSST